MFFFCFTIRRTPIATRTYTLFPYTTLFRSPHGADRTAQVGYPPRGTRGEGVGTDRPAGHGQEQPRAAAGGRDGNGPRRPDRIRGRAQGTRRRLDRKSTRLNSSH